MEENVNMPDRETSLLSPPDHQTIGVVQGFPTAIPSGSSTTISFNSSASSSIIDPCATRTFTSTTLVQDASEVRIKLNKLNTFPFIYVEDHNTITKYVRISFLPSFS